MASGNVISIYDQNSKWYRILQCACIMASGLDTGSSYQIENVWYDYGAGMSWTTIIKGSQLGGYQWLSPYDQEELLKGGFEKVYSFVTNMLLKEKNKNW